MKNLIILIITFFTFSKISYAQPGELDSSFGTNGIVKSDLGAKMEYVYLEKQVLELPDGSMYVISEQDGQTLVGKRFKDGSRDTSFGRNGISRPVGMIEEHAMLQPDGKVVLVGLTNLSNSRDFIIARYDTDGSLDNSFSGDGKQTTKFESSSFATALALQDDGKIVVAGYTPSVDDMGEKNSDFAIARYNTDGTLDSSFSKDGKLVTSGSSTDDIPTAVAIQSNGKILVAGYSINNAPNNLYSFSTIIRYNENGSIDSSFSVDNEKFGFLFAYPNAMVIQPDGKIVVAGQSITSTTVIGTGQDNATTTTDIFVARYNTNGSIDKSFNHKGWETSDFGYDNENAFAVQLQSNGKIMVGCNIWNGTNTDFGLARYKADGGLDSSFSSNGLIRTDFDYGEDKANLMSIHDNGEILLAGNNNYSNFAMARYKSNGNLDSSLNGNGKLSSNLNHYDQGSTYFTGTAIQSDGKVLIGGNTWNGNNTDFALVRYNNDGTLDNTFGNEGLKTTDLSVYKDGINSIVIQADEKIVAGGYTSDQSGTRFALARYNKDGTLDSSFSGNGIQNTNLSWYGQINSIALQTDGKIVAAGNIWNGSNNDFAVARYNTNGSLDSTFSNDGILQTDLNSSEDNGKSVVMQNDGKIVVAGSTYNYANTDFVIIRYNTDGTIDTTFAADGILTFNIGGNDDASGATIQPDGKIVVAGSTYKFDDYDYSNTDITAARFNPDGTPDNTFGNKGVVVTDLGNNDQASAVAMEGNGKILVAGVSNSRFAVVRYNPDGSLDTTFSQNGISTISSKGANAIENSIQGIAVSNNRLYVAGNGKYPGNLGVVVRYQLDQGIRKPIVSITTPANNAIYAAPATIKLSAVATDVDGTITKVAFYSGTTLLNTTTTAPYSFTWNNVPAGDYTITAKATDNNGMVGTSDAVKVTVLPHKIPTVSIVNPVDNDRFPVATTIHLRAIAIDPEGTITKVEFYNGSTLLHTEIEAPYTYTWKNAAVGNYKITAKATNNFGLTATSGIVHISVVPNKAPSVVITNIANNQVIAGPGTIPLVASAKDPDGTISKVEFYSGGTLIGTQYLSPYAHSWKDVAAGTYTITAKAIDNLGLSTTSSKVTITVAAPDTTASGRPSAGNKNDIASVVSLKAWPNPAGNVLNINAGGLPQNKQITISIISPAGVAIRTIQSNGFNQAVQVNVSSLSSGMYTLKVVCGDKVMYKQFIKL